jgi:hypothetical protein
MDKTKPKSPEVREGGRPEVAEVFRRYLDAYLADHRMSGEQLKAARHIVQCRTAALGGHIVACDTCNHTRNAYNSCRDRHCPKCQAMAKERWLADRRAELVPCGYFHLVFTIPHLLNPLILYNRRICLNLLFASVNRTLQLFGADSRWRLNGKLGFIGVLHTWSQTLIDHFHLHCLIPAGALSGDGKSWHRARRNYLFRLESLAACFRNRYLEGLRKGLEREELALPPGVSRRQQELLLARAEGKEWIAYAKRPFAGPEQVLEYLGGYTHRVAIGNHRLRKIGDGKVTFAYKDRKNGNAKRSMTVEAKEFIRRFLLHVLPEGFTRIRYFGFMAHTKKRESIPKIRRLIDPLAPPPEKPKKETARETMLRVTGIDIDLCPVCGEGRMMVVGRLVPCKENTS